MAAKICRMARGENRISPMQAWLLRNPRRRLHNAGSIPFLHKTLEIVLRFMSRLQVFTVLDVSR